MKKTTGTYMAVAVLAAAVAFLPVPALAAAPAAEAVQAQPPLSFGIVDVREVKALADISKDLNKQVEDKMEQNRKSISGDFTAIEKKHDALAKEQSTLKQEDFQKKMGALMKEAQTKQNSVGKRNQQLNDIATVAFNKLNDQIEQAAAYVAKEHNLSAVFTQDVVVVAEKRANITDEVISYLNKNGKKIKVDWNAVPAAPKK